MKKHRESYFSRRAFSIFAIITTLLLLFASPVAKAQEDSARYFDANFPAQILPSSDETVQNNLADVENIKTEIAVWEEDLGKEVTDGSYIGSICESSTFEFDYKPLMENDSYTFSGWVAVNNSRDYDVWNRWTNTGRVPDGDAVDFEYTFDILKKRSIVNIATIVNFSNRVIMSGASQFWVKMPVKANSVNFAELTPTVSMISLSSGEVFDSSLLKLEDGYRVCYRIYPTYTVWDIDGHEDKAYYSYAGQILDQYGGNEQIRVSYNGRDADIVQPIENKYVINNNVYAKISGTVEPNTNYIIVFSAMYNGKPQLLLTEDDLCSNDRYCLLQTNDLEFTEISNDNVWEAGIEQFHKRILNVSTSTTISPPTPDGNIEFPVDPSFSFIFKAGRGSFGMYGQYFELKANQSLVFYKDIDFSGYAGDKFLSVNIPIISDVGIRANVTVELLPCYYKYNKFEGQGVVYTFNDPYNVTPANESSFYVHRHPYWWQSEEPLTFNDYILFTVPQKIDYETLDSSIITAKIIITFVEDAEITFMFSTIDSSKVSETIKDVVANNVDRTWNSDSWGTMPTYNIRKHLTYFYNELVTEPYFEPVWYFDWQFYDHDFDDIVGVFSTHYYNVKTMIPNPQDCEIVHAEIFCSVQLTDGMWHQIVTTNSGEKYATHYFERRVAIGLVELWVDTTNNESEHQEAWWNESAGFFNQAIESLNSGDILGAISSGISSVISFLWNGLQEMLGVISSTFHKVWDFLVGVGRFIKSVLMSFVGQVLSIVGDIMDNVEKVLAPALYIIALLIFMYVIAWAGRLIYNPTGGF